MFSGYTGISVTVHPSVHVSVCVQNISFYQSADWGIKSHLVTALGLCNLGVFSSLQMFPWYC